MTNDPLKRLERLENRLLWGHEVEDLTETDLEIYGLEAVKEIYQMYGPKAVKALLYRPDLSGESKIIIADFLCRNHK